MYTLWALTYTVDPSSAMADQPSIKQKAVPLL